MTYSSKSFLALLLAGILWSCEDSSQSTTTPGDSEAPLVTQIEEVYPAELTSEQSDTTLNWQGNRYQLLLEKFTMPDSFVKHEVMYETGKDTVVFRDWALFIRLLKDGQPQIVDTLTKYELHPYPDDVEFLSQATIHAAWLVEGKSFPTLHVAIGVPDTDFMVLVEATPGENEYWEVAEVETAEFY